MMKSVSIKKSSDPTSMGFSELMKLGLYYPHLFQLVFWMIQWHLDGLTKRVLGLEESHVHWWNRDWKEKNAALLHDRRPVGGYTMHRYIFIFIWLAFLMCSLAVAAETGRAGKAEKAEKATAAQTMVSKEKVPAGVQKDEEFKQMVTKTMSGDVSARGSNGIAIVYERDKVKRSSQELYFPYEVELELTGYKTKMDIEEGDKVTVTYDEAEDGSKRVLTGIRLLKKKPPEEVIPEEAEGEEKER